jgi:small subunit ribosomal protein S6
MPLYESVIIARQDMSTTQVEGLADNLAALIEENGGNVVKREHWGLKNLNYRIKKNRKGHYLLFNLDAPSPAVQEMERNMRINEDVLRYLTLRIDQHEEGPSVMMQSRSSRDDRPGRGRDDRPGRNRDDRPGRDRDDRPGRGRDDRPARDRDAQASETAAAEGAKT